MGAESERGVLRRQVPQWLSLPEFRSLVVGFEEAHIGHAARARSMCGSAVRGFSSPVRTA